MSARSVLIVPMLLMSAGFSQAAEVTLTVPGAVSIQRSAVTYTCGLQRSLTVTYVNFPPNALAILPVEGQTLVFANVLSGSGARYASGPYVWWTKGNHGSLTDERQPNGKSLLECDAK